MNNEPNKPNKVAWHERIDKDEIDKHAIIFIKAVQKIGLAVTDMQVCWEGRSFTAKTTGKPAG